MEELNVFALFRLATLELLTLIFRHTIVDLGSLRMVTLTTPLPNNDNKTVAMQHAFSWQASATFGSPFCVLLEALKLYKTIKDMMFGLDFIDISVQLNCA